MKKIIIPLAITACLALTLFTLIQINKGTEHGDLDAGTTMILLLSKVIHTPVYLDKRSVDEIRESAAANGGLVSGSTVDVGEVYDTEFTHKDSPVPIKVRVYVPEKENISKSHATGGANVVIYYHGGGWVIGDLDSHDNVSRKICKFSEATVVSVDYRLAPENKYPAAVQDAAAALKWVQKKFGNYTKIAVAGDSAGGNLAAVTSLYAGKNNIKLRGQVLFYPVTDLSTMDRPSYNNFKEGFILEKGDMIWFRNHYVPDSKNWKKENVSPLYSNNLKYAPPTFIVTPRFDVLHDEGVAFADKLKNAGVPVRHINVEGTIHGYVVFQGIPCMGDNSVEKAGLFLKEIFKGH